MTFEDFRSEYSASEFGKPSSVFHEFSYLAKMEEVLESPLRIFVSRSTGDRDGMAMAMFSRTDHDGLTLAPFTPLSPIWLGEANQESLRDGLDSICAHLSEIKGRHHCHLSTERVAEIIHLKTWTTDRFYTYHIDLTDGLWRKKYSKSLSRILKKSKNEVFVEIDNAQSAVVCDFVAASYERNGRNLPLKVDSMKALSEAMIKQGLAEVYLAKDKSSGEIKAGVICLGNSERSYYWMAGGDRGVWMTMLIDDLLRIQSEKSVKTFDLLGANHASIAEFKRRFGGELIPYQGFQTNVGAQAKIKATISGIINK